MLLNVGLNQRFTLTILVLSVPFLASFLTCKPIKPQNARVQKYETAQSGKVIDYELGDYCSQPGEDHHFKVTSLQDTFVNAAIDSASRQLTNLPANFWEALYRNISKTPSTEAEHKKVLHAYRQTVLEYVTEVYTASLLKHNESMQIHQDKMDGRGPVQKVGELGELIPNCQNIVSSADSNNLTDDQKIIRNAFEKTIEKNNSSAVYTMFGFDSVASSQINQLAICQGKNPDVNNNAIYLATQKAMGDLCKDSGLIKHFMVNNFVINSLLNAMNNAQPVDGALYVEVSDEHSHESLRNQVMESYKKAYCTNRLQIAQNKQDQQNLDNYEIFWAVPLSIVAGLGQVTGGIAATVATLGAGSVAYPAIGLATEFLNFLITGGPNLAAFLETTQALDTLSNLEKTGLPTQCDAKKLGEFKDWAVMSSGFEVFGWIVGSVSAVIFTSAAQGHEIAKAAAKSGSIGVQVLETIPRKSVSELLISKSRNMVGAVRATIESSPSKFKTIPAALRDYLASGGKEIIGGMVKNAGSTAKSGVKILAKGVKAAANVGVKATYQVYLSGVSVPLTIGASLPYQTTQLVKALRSSGKITGLLASSNLSQDLIKEFLSNVHNEEAFGKWVTEHGPIIIKKLDDAGTVVEETPLTFQIVKDSIYIISDTITEVAIRSQMVMGGMMGLLGLSMVGMASFDEFGDSDKPVEYQKIADLYPLNSLDLEVGKNVTDSINSQLHTNIAPARIQINNFGGYIKQADDVLRDDSLFNKIQDQQIKERALSVKKNLLDRGGSIFKRILSQMLSIPSVVPPNLNPEHVMYPVILADGRCRYGIIKEFIDFSGLYVVMVFEPADDQKHYWTKGNQQTDAHYSPHIFPPSEIIEIPDSAEKLKGYAGWENCLPEGITPEMIY